MQTEHDADLEARDWDEAISSVIAFEGSVRADELLGHAVETARRQGARVPFAANTAYINTIPPHKEVPHPGNRSIEHTLRSAIRWNALAMVLRANKHSTELGGHIASFQSAATLYDTGFMHFWHGESEGHGGDLIFVQGHSSPGIYARAFLEGRLTEDQLLNFRQEADGKGLSSYPHPWLKPDFWQFPTVSMGLGPIMAIYQARFLKYLHDRGLADTSNRHVWVFCGDGEMDEPESLGAISLAGREKLDNLIFVINCNLQRLDGPVRGNGKIIQELEGNFRGAGWNVLKVIWGTNWDELLARDVTGRLRQLMEECNDGQYQDFKAKDGAYIRKNFFGRYPETAALVADWSDDKIWSLTRGGHDPRKVYAAYAAAVEHKEQPTVILAKTVKGYGMGEAGEGQMIAHQQKKMGKESLARFRDRFGIKLSDADLETMPFITFPKGSPEHDYLMAHRQALGGPLPKRRAKTTQVLKAPPMSFFEPQIKGSGEREISTTMAFVQLLTKLMRDTPASLIPSSRICPVYAQTGQLYRPEDAEQLLTLKSPILVLLVDVPVIEVHVRAGSEVKPEDPLITLESDKATMEVPSPHSGTIVEVLVRPGDRVNTGVAIVRLEVAGTAAGTDAMRPLAPVAAAPSSGAVPATPSFGADITCDLVVLGAGPGGYSAAFRAADLGLKTVLVERHPTLGGVCLNVGCIPSKALLHVAAVMDEATALSSHGITFAAPKIDLDALRRHKDKIVGKLTSGLSGMAKGRTVGVIQGAGRFLDPLRLEVELAAGGKTVVRFEKAIIAAGSEAVKLPFLPGDPRVVDSTGALELPFVPKRMLVIGGGIIGLEMATVYSTLGAPIDIVEMLDELMAGADRDLVSVWQKFNAKRFNRVMLKTKAAAAEAKKDGIHVRFEGADAPKDSQVYDLVLVAVGRTPNGKRIDAEKAGVNVDGPGFIPVDSQMRTNVAHIFAIGDIAAPPMLAHKAVHEGHVAAEAAAGKKSLFDARQIPSVAYTDPEIAWTGKTEDEFKEAGAKYVKAVFPWAASGRALANARAEGFTKLLFDEKTHNIIGGGIVGAHAGDLISEICLAIEMGADGTDIGKTIHPHPTLSESIGMAAEAFEGVCTDLPPTRKQ